VEVVGEASSADEAVARAAEVEPDVVIMDVRMPGRSGVEACRDIRAARQETKVLMLTSYSDDEALFTAIMAGASGYLLKNIGGNDFVRDVGRHRDRGRAARARGRKRVMTAVNDAGGGVAVRNPPDPRKVAAGRAVSHRPHRLTVDDVMTRDLWPWHEGRPRTRLAVAADDRAQPSTGATR
jgi:DNA-binding NarL/FixJ family response regulator